MPQSIRENGVYVGGIIMMESYVARFRNYFLARTLGVRRISIGPQSKLLGLSCIDMGEDFCAGNGLWLHAVLEYNRQRFSPRIVIGNHVHVSQWVHIAATNLVQIGNDVLMGSKVIITDHNHGQYSRRHSSPDLAPASRPLDRDRTTVIGDRVWLGDGVVVAPGACIGDGSVIGPNSVVRGEIPPACIATGIPARVTKAFDFRAQKWVSVESFVSGCSEIEQD
jgi:lipopolysaccharide O-acetyltransferase